MKSRGINRRPVRLLCLSLTVICLCKSQPQTQSKPITSVQELINLASDPNAAKTNIDYQQVSRFLSSLTPPERQSVERQLIALPHEGLAGAAVVSEIRNRDVTAITTIAARIPLWRKAQTQALVEVAVQRGPFLDIPRALLKDIVKSGKSIEPTENLEPSEMAALLVAQTGTPADIQILQDLVRIQSRSWGVWMAIAAARALAPALAPLATATYQDAKLPLRVRVAAAAALEPLDSRAAAFALTQIDAFLSKFSSVTASSLFTNAVRSSPNTKTSSFADYQEYRDNIRCLGALFVLASDSVRGLTIRCLTYKNEELRKFCGVVVARRWPEDLLRTGQGLFSGREYADLLTIISLYRPEHAAVAAGGITPADMAAATARVKRGGLAASGLPGVLLLFF